MCFDEIRIDGERFGDARPIISSPPSKRLLRARVKISARAVGIYFQRVVEKQCCIAVSVFFGEQFSGAELCFEIIRIGFDCRAIHVVRVLESFEMDQGACDQVLVRGRFPDRCRCNT